MKIEDFNIGDKVQVLITNPKENKDEWRNGEVINKGIIYPTGTQRHDPYPKFTVKYTHTYYRKLKDNYDGIVWVSEDGEFYNKENESLFFIDGTIKKVEI